MTRRFARLRNAGFVALAITASMAIGLAPTAMAKKKKKKKTVEVTKTATVNQCVNVSSPIDDEPFSIGTATIPVSLPPLRGQSQPGSVTALTSVGVRLSHGFDGDLLLLLVSPNGTTVTLAAKRGGAGDDYGSGLASCSGTRTFFGDAFATPISTGTPPFAGFFRPDQLLSSLVGGPANGIWKLLVIDTADGDEGVLHAFSLNFTYTYKQLMTVKKKKKK